MSFEQSFEALVLAPVRGYLGRGIKVPSGATWSTRTGQINGEGVLHLHVDLTVDALAADFQKDLPAAPSFLLCLAYWIERATGVKTRCKVRFHGDPPTGGSKLLHWRRSLFLLHELDTILGERFAVEAPDRWRWPSRPVLNAPKSARSTAAGEDDKPEHRLEAYLCREPAALDSFFKEVTPITRFRRQLPVGLFEGKVSKDTAWTPGGGSQIDLWAQSPDGRVLHLFELKALTRSRKPNAKVGIIPEALYYARLLHHVRVGLGDGRQIEGGGEGVEAARKAEKVVMWLVAPAYHPLVFLDQETPLEWVNEGMAGDGVEIRGLPIELDGDGLLAGWRPESG